MDYSIESFINYLNEEDDYATEGLVKVIKNKFEDFVRWITKILPLKITQFLNNHPKFRNLPVIKQLYAKLKAYERRLRQLRYEGLLNKWSAPDILKELNKMGEDVEGDIIKVQNQFKIKMFEPEEFTYIRFEPKGLNDN